MDYRENQTNTNNIQLLEMNDLLNLNSINTININEIIEMPNRIDIPEERKSKKTNSTGDITPNISMIGNNEMLDMFNENIFIEREVDIVPMILINPNKMEIIHNLIKTEKELIYNSKNKVIKRPSFKELLNNIDFISSNLNRYFNLSPKIKKSANKKKYI